MITSNPIVIVPYDPAWVGQFAGIAAQLRANLGDLALRIDHIGSTAVVGLPAKPTIDIQISVADLEPCQMLISAVEAAGVPRFEVPDSTKWYFRDPAHTAHIHMRRIGSWSEQFTLLFRDYLRAQPTEAALYAAEKYRLAQACREDRVAYSLNKDEIVYLIMRRANVWSQGVGWQPGASDA